MYAAVSFIFIIYLGFLCGYACLCVYVSMQMEVRGHQMSD